MIYAYECQDCKKTLDVVQRMSDEPLKICPNCGSYNFHKVMTVPMYCSVKIGKSDIKTLGHLAQRNSDEMDKKGLLPPESPKKKEQKLMKKLAKLNKTQQKDYVERGVLP